MYENVSPKYDSPRKHDGPIYANNIAIPKQVNGGH